MSPRSAVLFLELQDRNIYLGYPGTLEKDFSGNITFMWNHFPVLAEEIEGYTIFFDNGFSIHNEDKIYLSPGDAFSVSYPVKNIIGIKTP